MYVQIVTYNLNGVREQDYIDIAHQVAPRFSSMGDLHAKVWLYDSESNAYAAVYFWEDRAAGERFQESELFEGTFPGFANVVTEGYDVHEQLTRATQPMLEIVPEEEGWATPLAADAEELELLEEPEMVVDEEPEMVVDEEEWVEESEFVEEPEPEPVVRVTRKVVKKAPKKTAPGRATGTTRASKAPRGTRGAKKVTSSRRVSPTRVTKATRATKVTKKSVQPRKTAAKKAKRLR